MSSLAKLWFASITSSWLECSKATLLQISRTSCSNVRLNVPHQPSVACNVATRYRKTNAFRLTPFQISSVSRDGIWRAAAPASANVSLIRAGGVRAVSSGDVKAGDFKSFQIQCGSRALKKSPASTMKEVDSFSRRVLLQAKAAPTEGYGVLIYSGMHTQFCVSLSKQKTMLQSLLKSSKIVSVFSVSGNAARTASR